jgi:hypothetical protein
LRKLPNLTDAELKAYGFNAVEISIWHLLTAEPDKEVKEHGNEKSISK